MLRMEGDHFFSEGGWCVEMQRGSYKSRSSGKKNWNKISHVPSSL